MTFAFELGIDTDRLDRPIDLLKIHPSLEVEGLSRLGRITSWKRGGRSKEEEGDAWWERETERANVVVDLFLKKSLDRM